MNKSIETIDLIEVFDLKLVFNTVFSGKDLPIDHLVIKDRSTDRASEGVRLSEVLVRLPHLLGPSP